MKKIYSIKERIIYIFLITFLIVIQFVLMINFHNNVGAIVAFYICVTLVVAALLKLFTIPYHIVVNDNRIKVYDFPLFATNRFYDKKSGLILWNSEIRIDEVKSATLVKLTKEEQTKYVGYIHSGNRYIKVDFTNSNSNKYIYVSAYSNSQIKQILNLFANK